MIDNIIFDLDGTLIDTIHDIASAVNDALAECGFLFHYSDLEAHGLIGDGADVLVHRALKNEDTPSNFERLKASYLPKYREYQLRTSKPFDGIFPMLLELKKMGKRLFVCTNKPDEYAKILLPRFFPDGLFGEIRGIIEGEAPKPDPTIVRALMAKHGLNEENTLFVGDSKTDLTTSRNAGLPLALCLWGYGFYNESLCLSAAYTLDAPSDLVRILS